MNAASWNLPPTCVTQNIPYILLMSRVLLSVEAESDLELLPIRFRHGGEASQRRLHKKTQSAKKGIGGPEWRLLRRKESERWKALKSLLPGGHSWLCPWKSWRVSPQGRAVRSNPHHPLDRKLNCSSDPMWPQGFAPRGPMRGGPRLSWLGDLKFPRPASVKPRVAPKGREKPW